MQNVFRLIAAAFVAIIIVLGLSNSAQAQAHFIARNDYYVLPGEYFHAPIQLQADTPAENLVAVDYTFGYYPLLTQGYTDYIGANGAYGTWADTLGCCGDYHFTWAAYGGWIDSGNLNRQELGGVTFFNQWTVGQEGNFWAYVFGYTLITNNEPSAFYADHNSTVHSIDGLRGDVNDDGLVNENDAFLINMYFLNRCPMESRYNQNGINIGRGNTGLFSNNTLVDAFLINTWIYNPDDPLVVALGIGQLMSETAYGNSSVQPAPYGQQINENELTVNTEGLAVAVFGTLPDGTPWQSSGFTTNGQFNCQLPDDLQNMRIEAVQLEGATDVNTPVTMPQSCELKQNYPNPFNPTTTIDFDLTKQAQVKLTVYNMAGQKVATLADGMMPAGHNSVNFDASNLASGSYFYTLTAADQTETKKMVLMK